MASQSIDSGTLYRNELATVYLSQASLQEVSGKHQQALATLQQAIELQDRLAADPTADLNCRQRAAELRLTLGMAPTPSWEPRGPPSVTATWR